MSLNSLEAVMQDPRSENVQQLIRDVKRGKYSLEDARKMLYKALEYWTSIYSKQPDQLRDGALEEAYYVMRDLKSGEEVIYRGVKIPALKSSFSTTHFPTA